MKVRLTKDYQLIVTPEDDVEQIALVAWSEKKERGEGTFLVEALPPPTPSEES